MYKEKDKIDILKWRKILISMF